jgi:hypothetical protein
VYPCAIAEDGQVDADIWPQLQRATGRDFANELPSARRTGKKLPNGRCTMVTKNPGIVCLTILSCITFSGAPVQSAQPERPINSVREIRASLRACWISPAVTKAPQLTVRLSLKRNGEILGQPLITYQTPGASEDERAALHAAVAATLARCTPLPISDELGGILAGRLINVKLGGMEAQRSADGFSWQIEAPSFQPSQVGRGRVPENM